MSGCPFSKYANDHVETHPSLVDRGCLQQEASPQVKEDEVEGKTRLSSVCVFCAGDERSFPEFQGPQQQISHAAQTTGAAVQS